MEKLLPLPGFRFHPTDVELVCFYLKRKVTQKPINPDVISELDIYKFAPWDLPGKSCLQSRDLEWYFYCPRDRKYANGPRTNRATEIGYWKTTGKDRPIFNHSRIAGIKKTLVFHIGRAPSGDRTNWVMHEYRLEDKNLAASGIAQESFVLCRIFEKSGPGPKNGEQYGAPFREEEWDDDVENFTEAQSLDDCNIPSNEVIENTNSCSVNATDMPFQHAVSNASGAGHAYHENSPSENDDIDKILLELASEGECLAAAINCDGLPSSKGNNGGYNENLNNPVGGAVEGTHVDSSDIYIGLEDITDEVKPERFCSIDNLIFPSGLPWLDQSVVEGSYLELNDLLCPEDLDSSVLQRTENSCVSDVLQASLISPPNLQNPFMPAEAVYTLYPVSNVECLYKDQFTEISSMDAFSVEGPCIGKGDAFTSPEQVSEKGSTSASAGEGNTKGDNANNQSGNGGSVSRLQSLLDCFPALPASAAEYPLLSNEGRNKDNSSAHCSCVNALTADTMNSVGVEGRMQCHCYDMAKGKRLDYHARKKAGADISWRGFSFVFFLSAVSATMWVLLFILGIKLGFKILWCAWKLILS